MMDPAITWICILASIVTLMPIALYLLRLTKDPFHPFIYLGSMSFGMITLKTFQDQEQLLAKLTPEDVVIYSLIMIVSVLGYYFGWWRSRVRTLKTGLPAKALWEYDTSKMLAFGFTLSVFATVMYFLTFQNFTITGYIQDLPQLWIISSVLLIQVLMVDPRHRIVASVGLAIALIHPFYNIIDHGQRGDTIRLAMVAMVPYLVTGRRPSRATVVTCGAVLAITLSALARTRPLVDSGVAKNRLDAVMQVGTTFFQDTDRKLDGSEEWIYGPAAVKTAWMSGKFGWGRVLTVSLPLRFLPKEFFPWKYDYYYNHVSFDRVEVPAYTGIKIPWGAAPTGYAEGYVEFWWFCPLFWGVLGYLHQKTYSRAIIPSDRQAQCLHVAFTIGISYLVLQEILFGAMNYIYTALPALLVYRYCRKAPSEYSQRSTYPVLADQMPA